MLSGIGALKALAHPPRQRLVTWLQRHGSATSADPAAEFGEVGARPVSMLQV